MILVHDIREINDTLYEADVEWLGKTYTYSYTIEKIDFLPDDGVLISACEESSELFRWDMRAHSEITYLVGSYRRGDSIAFPYKARYHRAA